MVIRTEDIKDVCSKILSAVDSSELSLVTETLALYTNSEDLYLAVTNREYYTQIKLPLHESVEFKATVNANVFLKLISQITTDTIELSVDDSTLYVKGNGTYKLPLIFDGENLLELPKIDINNITTTFGMSGDILTSILNYNSKEISKVTKVARPVQKLYYVDECGAITFTTGACVNNFTLPEKVKILLNPRIVKLFKLFKGESVTFSLGHDVLSNGTNQTKVRFANDTIEITSILPSDDSMISSVPASAIRDRATKTYDYSIVVNKDELLQTINRLLLFTVSSSYAKTYSKFLFEKDGVTIYDAKEDNKEKIYYKNELDSLESNSYNAIIDMVDLKATLDGCNESYVNINFGDSQAFVIARGNIYNVIPEIQSI